MANKVLYVARNDGTDTRVTKECGSLVRAGYDVHFLGWSTQLDAVSEDLLPGATKLFYPAAHSSNRVENFIRLLGFGRFLVRSIREIRPDVVHCVNEDLGLFTVLLQRRYGFRSLCDVFDSIALRWARLPFPMNACIRRVAEFVHARSDALVVTDETRKRRLGPHVDKAWTVGNFPVDPGAEIADASRRTNGRIRLYVSGSLMIPRGLESIREILDRRDDVEVVSAGWLYDEFAQEFVRHPSVDYRGVISPLESLRAAASCDAVLALYEPSNENNVLASPNKVYDALCIGRPVIVNGEAKVSEWVQRNDTGFVVPYGDVEALDGVVTALAAGRDEMPSKAARLRRLFETGYSWDVAERRLLAAYASLSERLAAAA